MAETNRLSKQDILRRFHNLRDLLVQKQTKPAPKFTSVATKILLDDAVNGFMNGNFVCSPFSLEIVLGMLAFGAKGKTLEQLLEFFGHETMDQLRSESPASKLFAQILASPNSGNRSLDINLANRVLVAKKFSPVCLLPSYKEVLNAVYNTDAQVVDFENKPKALQEINSWASKKTQGVIPIGISKHKDHINTLRLRVRSGINNAHGS